MTEVKNKISVVTIVKNGLPFIKSAIKSFNLQNYPNKELIIVYGKSTDGTEEFLKSIEQNNITIKRPGTGISPMKWDDYLGRTAKREYQIDELIKD